MKRGAARTIFRMFFAVRVVSPYTETKVVDKCETERARLARC